MSESVVNIALFYRDIINHFPISNYIILIITNKRSIKKNYT